MRQELKKRARFIVTGSMWGELEKRREPPLSADAVANFFGPVTRVHSL